MNELETIGTQGVEDLWAGRLRLAIHELKQIVRREAAGAVQALFEDLEAAGIGLDIEIAQAPKEPAIRVRRGICRFAQAILLSLQRRNPGDSCRKAIADFLGAVALRPQEPMIRLHLANALMFSVRYGGEADSSGTLEAAMSDLDAAIRQDGTLAPAYHSRGLALLQRARLHRREGWDSESSLTRAIDDLTRAAKLEPGNALVLRDLGVAKMGLAKQLKSGAVTVLSEALSHLDRACNSAGATAAFFYRRGQAHFALKHFAEAWEDFTHCVVLDSSFHRKATRWIDRTCRIAV